MRCFQTPWGISWRSNFLATCIEDYTFCIYHLVHTLMCYATFLLTTITSGISSPRIARNTTFLNPQLNVGLIVGIIVGVLVFLIIFIGLPICVVAGIYCKASRTNRPVQTRVGATTPRPRTTTELTSSQTGTSSVAPAQYPLQPVYKDTQLNYQVAPPFYTDVTSYQPAVQVTAK